MRILVLGAGATGGYFGGRLAQAGGDVTFLVRERRAAQLRAHGLVIQTPKGREHFPVSVVTEADPQWPYDLAILSCKAYDLDSAIAALQPALGQTGLVLPLLNGLAHYGPLEQAFGADRVLGGLCHLSAALESEGDIRLLGPLHRLTFGERQGPPQSARCATLAAVLAPAAFDSHHSPDISQDSWEKFAFLAAAAGITCLLRAPVGAIVATEDGAALTLRIIDECEAIAAASGYPVREAARAMTRRTLLATGSPFTASMLRDLRAGGRIEAWQIIGDLRQRGLALGVPVDTLSLAWCQLQAYEAQS